MSKKVKILIFSLLAAVVLVVLCLVGIGMYITSNANDYKDYLAEVIYDKTGMKVKFNGDFSVSVFPWIGVEAADVSIENHERFKSLGENLLSADKLGVELRVIPLLQGNIEVGDVRVEGLKLGLGIDKDGVANWIFKTPAEEAEAAADSSETSDAGSLVVVEEEQPEIRSGPPALSIGSVKLADSYLSYEDARSGEKYQLANLNLDTGNLGLGRDVDLELAAELDLSEPDLAGALDVDAQFNFTDAQNLEISQLKGKLSSKRGLLGQGEAVVNLSMSLAGASLDVRECLLEVAGTKLALSGKGNIENLTFTGPLNVQSKPKDLLALFGADLGLPASALEAFSLNAQFSSDKANETRISNIDAKLDASSLSGDLLVTSGVAPQISGKLVLDSLTLDNYLPGGNGGSTSSSGSGAGNAGASDSGGGSAKYEAPKLGLDVDLSVGSLSAKGMQFSNINGKIKGKDAVYSADPLSFDFATSKWNAAASANLKQATPAVGFKLNAANIAVEEVLKALTGKAQVAGKADLNLDLKGNGAGADAIMKSLGGNMRISAKGSLTGFKLPQINLAAAPGVKRLDTVDAKLNNFSASFSGANGVFNNSDMAFDTSLARGSGKGAVNLGAGSVNYLVTVETSTVNLPVRISGPLSSPSYALDAEAMLTDPANLRKGTEKLIDQHGDKIGREIERGLGKLFGN